MFNLLWSQIKESYEAQARECDKKAVEFQADVTRKKDILRDSQQKVRDLECRISELGEQQPASSWTEMDRMSVTGYVTERTIPVKWESVAKGADGKQRNAALLRVRQGDLNDARFAVRQFEIEILECEAEAHQFRERALEIRNKASALIEKMPNFGLQIKQLYLEIQACQCDKKAFQSQMEADRNRHILQNIKLGMHWCEFRISVDRLEDPQPSPFWQPVHSLSRTLSAGNPLVTLSYAYIPAGYESVSEWSARKRVVRELKMELDGHRCRVCERANAVSIYEAEAQQWREKARELRDEAFASTSGPIPDIELSERSRLLGSDKRSNYKAIELNTT
jgi:hypothetical protein